ncbi:acyltransferase family protein [Hephaestia sp. GCM10023244]|uniref:acyltransferase family protein n=1 Tax=unclassified Hephaestia TaxID=2631281 RepID=UPI0020771B70|nr:acyltransferase [Hephaestia sp. MAHUQ-44]MCM8729492.1 acyltransferase [Hephaestia sp. MAHUQ-44]
MSARPELRALTSVRGLAAWMVVLYHIRLSIAGLPQAWVDVFAKGYLAVDFFFLLSGFVIWLTYGARLREGGTGVVAFWQRRIARIYPLHLLMLISAMLLALALAATGRHDPVEFPFAALPLHLLLVQDWGVTEALAWNDPAWSISAEFAAYLLFPLLARAIDWRRVSTFALIAAIAAFLAILGGVMARAGAPGLGWEISTFGLLRCLTEFSAGTALCALWLRWAERPLIPAIGSAIVAMLLLGGWAMGSLSELFAVPMGMAALLLLLALTAGRARNPLEWAPLHYLGEISYATYLSHFLLFVVFKLLLVSDASAIPPLLIALYLLLVLAASVALYHLVERPAQKWLNAVALPGTKRSPAHWETPRPREEPLAEDRLFR